MYRYFISYAVYKDGDLGFGNSEIIMDKLLTQYDQIIQIQNEVLPENQSSNFVILDYNYLGEDDE